MENNGARKLIIGKEAFELYNSSDGDISKLRDLAKGHFLSYTTVRNYMYYFKNNSVDPKPSSEDIELHRRIVDRKKAGKRFDSEMGSELHIDNSDEKIISELLSLSTLGELIAWMIECPYSYSIILEEIDLYVKGINPDNKSYKKLDLIKEKLLSEKCREEILPAKNKKAQALNHLREKEKRKSIITNIITELLIDDSVTLESLLNKVDYSKKWFTDALELLKSGSVEERLLHRQYFKWEEMQFQKSENLLKEVKFYLSNKIQKNGKAAPFTILDYHRLSDISPRDFISKLFLLNRKGRVKQLDFQTIKDFFNLDDPRNRVLTPEVLLEKIDFKIDSLEVDINLKQRIISYLESIGAPLTIMNYLYAFAEYNEGLLNLEILMLV